MFIFVDMKIFLWRYISYEPVEMRPAWLHHHRKQQLVFLLSDWKPIGGIGGQGLKISRPLCLLQTVTQWIHIYYLSMYNLQHSAPGCFVSDQMCSLKNVSSAFLYINGFFFNVIQEYVFSKSKMLCPIKVQALQPRMSYQVVLIITDCAYLLFIPLIYLDHERQWPRLI